MGPGPEGGHRRRGAILTDSTSFQFRTWTTHQLAKEIGVSRWTVIRATKRLMGLLDPPRYARNGSHPRRHRVYTDREASLIAEAILKIPYTLGK